MAGPYARYQGRTQSTMRSYPSIWHFPTASDKGPRKCQAELSSIPCCNPGAILLVVKIHGREKTAKQMLKIPCPFSGQKRRMALSRYLFRPIVGPEQAFLLQCFPILSRPLPRQIHIRPSRILNLPSGPPTWQVCTWVYEPPHYPPVYLSPFPLFSYSFNYNRSGRLRGHSFLQFTPFDLRSLNSKYCTDCHSVILSFTRPLVISGSAVPSF